MRILDWPPVWLAGAMALVWSFDQIMPWSMFGTLGRVIGAGLGIAGVALMMAAAAQMIAARTTVIPRQRPNHLVTGGVFRLSRNPIYLGDAFVLAAAVLWWDVPPGLPVLLAFVLLIQHRFILGEEAVLRAQFGAGFDDWTQQTRRWL